MPTQLVTDPAVDDLSVVPAAESAVLECVDLHSPVNLDDVAQRLSGFSWNQIFHAVDRLARGGKLLLRRQAHTYQLLSLRGVCQLFYRVPQATIERQPSQNLTQM